MPCQVDGNIPGFIKIPSPASVHYVVPCARIINYLAAEQRGILKSIERPKGRGLVCR